MREPDLLVISEDWGGLPSPTQHLVRRLAANRRVLWVNSLGLRRPRMRGTDLRRLARKGREAIGGVLAKGPPPAPWRGVRVLPPLALPLPGSTLALRVNRALLGWQIRRALARSGIERPVFLTSLPTGLAALGSFEAHAVVYYCGDDFSALHGVDHVPVARLEADLAARADLIVAASETIAARFPAEKTILLPHGVDFELFSQPAAQADDLPRGGLIAGFYGSIAEWLDFELLAEVARGLPDWTFVMVGPIRCDVSALDGVGNLRLLGLRPHSDLPRYVQHWSVSMIPFRRTAQIQACNPLKLREYLAAGTPVVATDTPALDGYRDLIEVAEGPEAFRAALLRATGDTQRNPLRRQRVAREDWRWRAEEIASALRSL